MSVRTNNSVVNKNRGNASTTCVSIHYLPSAGSICPASEHTEFSLARVIDLNNRACYLLNSGEEDEQIVLEMFHSAIACLSAHARGCANVPGPADSVAIANAPATFQTQTLPSSPMLTTASPTSTSCMEEEDGCINILDRLILIDEQNPKTIEFYPLYAACLFCNMAILYHRLAIQKGWRKGGQQQQLLAKACSLYQIVYQSLSNTGLQDDTTLGLCTVSLNNIAELCRLEDRHDHLANVIQQLKPLIALQQHQRMLEQQPNWPPQQQQEPYHLVSSNDLGRIVLNLMIWKVPDIAAAA
jgi:hypothetical protein